MTKLKGYDCENFTLIGKILYSLREQFTNESSLLYLNKC